MSKIARRPPPPLPERDPPIDPSDVFESHPLVASHPSPSDPPYPPRPTAGRGYVVQFSEGNNEKWGRVESMQRQDGKTGGARVSKGE